MSTELPIACSLSAGELHVRQAQIAELGDDALVEARVEGRHADLSFKGGAAVRERVERFVAAESECCAFLAMRVEETATDVRLAYVELARAERAGDRQFGGHEGYSAP